MDVDHGTLEPVEQMSISEFKATCLAVLERVRLTGQPVLVTRRGEPVAEVVPPSVPLRTAWMGSARGSGDILGDLVEPAVDPAHWDVLSR